MTGGPTEQWAFAEGNATITQVAGDYVTYGVVAAPAPRALSGLPEAPAALVGRDGPVEELLGVLGPAGPAGPAGARVDAGPGGARVAVVAGLAGVGKSALAVATAHRAVELGWFGDRVFFLALRGYAPNGAVSGPQAVQEMLRHLGIRDTDMPASPEARLHLYRAELAARAQAGERVLIVADDAGSVAQVRDLVPAQDAHRLLVTSRHRLVAPGFSARIVALDELAADAAAELLAGALLRTWPEDPRPERDPGALAEIADHCGRLPLALTVAGALLAGDPGLPAGELARQLSGARTRLATLHIGEEGDGDVPVGVRAAFDLSYARLPADQARLLRLLTVVPGPDCATAYAHLLTRGSMPRPDGPPEELAAVRASLAALVRASMLIEQPVGSGRWRMHDLVRLYARERGEEQAGQDGREGVIDALLASLAFDAAVACHALGVDGRAASGPGLPSVAQALQWLDGERPMLVAAVGFAAAAGRPDITVELAGRLAPYLALYGHAPDAVVVAHHVLEVGRESGDRTDVGAALYNLGMAHLDAWQMAEASALLGEALVLFREVPEPLGEARSLNLLGSLYTRERRWEEAREAHEQALEIFRAQGIRHAEATALVNLAHVLKQSGRVDEAVEACEQAHRLLKETGDDHRAATAQGVLGDVLWEAGRREESLAVREEALAALRELGHRAAVAWLLNGIGASLTDGAAGPGDERLDAAQARYEEALALFVEVGNRHGEGAVLGNLGRLHRLAGRLEEALESQRQGCDLLAATGDRDNEAVAVQGMALTLLELNRPAEAAGAFERAAALHGAVGNAGHESAVRAVAAQLRAMPAAPAGPVAPAGPAAPAESEAPATPGAPPPRRWWDRFRD
ncbi:tetratricopeptide repeat protein [Streptomyces sp. KS 21]|uniref:tetratricopeptide repeat protein n=1 Tax=Streptomyces sp. KS 21 TaxID=2485150 RepID=UPI0010634C31|nr:tetratricopeptide repeat protein [Streptomyces sp. KS 21]TDU76742.1 NB-ARC domain-containing protein [Streptomyces sp. KS 21]